MARRSFYKSKTFRYGSVATAFTVVFIALVIVFNAIFTALANKYMWYVDMTEDDLYTLSDGAKTLLSDINDEVKIIFASEPDELTQGSNSGYMKYIYTTALQFEEEFDNITVECHNVVKENTFFEPYKNLTNSSIYTTSVIVECGSEFRLFTAQAFFIFDSDSSTTPWAYNGEEKMISGILQVTATETPIVYFTTEHGEDLSGAQNLMMTFYDCGFDVRTVNLANETISEDARIIVVYDPKYDFLGMEAEDSQFNEISKIDAFLDSYGCLMVFGSPDNVGKLTNLNEFLEEWGIRFVADTTVKDPEHSISVDGYSILSQYLDSDSLGGSIYREMSGMDTPPKTAVRKACPIEILWESGGSLSGSRQVASVLKSYDTAGWYNDTTLVNSGEANIVTVSRESRVYNNETYYSYVMAFGSPSFAADSYLVSNVYGNSDIMYASMKAMGREKVLADIDFKVFDDTSLSITTAQANNWTVALTVVPPFVAAVVGLVVWTRRKYE